LCAAGRGRRVVWPLAEADKPACANPVVSGQRRMWCAGRCLARASRERRASCSGASPRRLAALCRQRGWRGLSGRVSPAGRFPPPASRTRQGLVAAGSPTTRVRLVRVPGLDDDGDRAPSDCDRRGASLAGQPDRRPSRPDRRPSRPVVSPTYAVKSQDVV